MNGSANNNSVTSSRTPSQQGACSYAEAQNGSRIKKSAPRSNNPVQPDKISSDGITERAAEEGIASPKHTEHKIGMAVPESCSASPKSARRSVARVTEERIATGNGSAELPDGISAQGSENLLVERKPLTRNRHRGVNSLLPVAIPLRCSPLSIEISCALAIGSDNNE
jgi:hypothetical protein